MACPHWSRVTAFLFCAVSFLFLVFAIFEGGTVGGGGSGGDGGLCPFCHTHTHTLPQPFAFFLLFPARAHALVVSKDCLLDASWYCFAFAFALLCFTLPPFPPPNLLWLGKWYTREIYEVNCQGHVCFKAMDLSLLQSSKPR